MAQPCWHSPDSRVISAQPAGGSPIPPLYFIRNNVRSTALDPANWRFVSVQVTVRDNNVDQALRALKKKMQREGIFREMKLRRNFEKPSEKRAREKAEAVRRYRKLMRKRMEREGF
jgi:small subunit ribosomal protein S21